MMKDNSGSLRKNERKEKPSHKDYTGSASINGTEYWIAAWIKQGEDGKWLSLAFTPKDEQKKAAPKTTSVRTDLDEEIPF